ncbi:MAG TPA: hypothetical protein VFB32_04680 [Rudaea sp.]|nr:hypothetical protein [Rudaea sp.]
MSSKRSVLAAMSFAFVLCSSGAIAADAPVTGKVTVKLEFVRAVQDNGSPDPAHDKACTEQLSQPTSKYVGMPVTTSYSIDAKTLIESATSTFPSPNGTKPIQLSAKLSPLGVAGVYAFGAFKPPALPDAYVLFQIGTDFKNPVSTFLVLNPSSTGYNCSISSAKGGQAVANFAAPAKD